MEVIDFSNVLPDFNKRAFVFNPSVAHWKDDLYLCVYRVFTRAILNAGRKYDRTTDKNHPWFSDAFWDQTPSWGNDKGRDSIGCVILKINEGKISLFKDLNNKVTEKYVGVLDLYYFPAVDPRLLHYKENLFVISYNVSYAEKSSTIRVGFLEITDSGATLYNPTDFCKEISQKIEKNWSFWKQDDLLFFSYNIAPSHEVFSTKINMKDKEITCIPKKKIDGNDYLGLLEKCYNSGHPQKKLFISLTTPAIQRKDKPNRHLGVGHLKFLWKMHDSELLKNTLLDVFYRENFDKIKYHHPYYDYFMFIYEFDSTTFELTNTSDFFIPRPDANGVLLSFPSGIEYDQNDNLMIFYGDGDSFCKALLIRDTPTTLDKMLKFPIVNDRINACSLLPGPDFRLI